MARDINSPMLHKEAVAYFEEWILPLLTIEETESQGGVWKRVDEPLRSETWTNWTDSLCKNRKISDWQYMNWSQPACCER